VNPVNGAKSMTDNADATALGEALYASLLQASLVVKLVMKGVLERDEAIDLVDTTLLILEHHQSDPNGPGAAVIGHARSRLESLLRSIQATPTTES
jgi:hypothetical protein